MGEVAFNHLGSGGHRLHLKCVTLCVRACVC